MRKSGRPLTASDTWRLAIVALITVDVATGNANVDADAGTLTEAGTVADGSLELNASVHPPAGAGFASVPLHCTGVPPVGIDGEQLTSATTGNAMTVIDAA